MRNLATVLTRTAVGSSLGALSRRTRIYLLLLLLAVCLAALALGFFSVPDTKPPGDGVTWLAALQKLSQAT